MDAHGNFRSQGYHRLADLMGPYQETAIFRRFGSLNMLNLLSLQAELVDLEVEFRDICQEDDQSSDADEKQFSSYFRKLRESRGSPSDDQLKALEKLRRKISEYNTALLQAAQLSKLPRPEDGDMSFLREWLAGDDEGDRFLKGTEAFTWEKPDRRENAVLERDLVTLLPASAEQDTFSRQMSTSLLNLYHKVWGGSHRRRKIIDPESGVMAYSDERLIRVNGIIISSLSSLIPILAIVALYFVRTMAKRIGLVAVFTTAFAFALAWFTNARRLEIFASTSAFAAVEVVFIGTVLPDGP